MNVSILLLKEDVVSFLGKDVASFYIKSFHREMFHQKKHIKIFSFEKVFKFNKKFFFI